MSTNGMPWQLKFSASLFAILFLVALAPGTLSANDGKPVVATDGGGGADENPAESDCD